LLDIPTLLDRIVLLPPNPEFAVVVAPLIIVDAFGSEKSLFLPNGARLLDFLSGSIFPGACALPIGVEVVIESDFLDVAAIVVLLVDLPFLESIVVFAVADVPPMEFFFSVGSLFYSLSMRAIN